MSKGILNIITLIYLTLVVTITFSINEISVRTDMEQKEKLKKILKNTMRRTGKLTGGLILIGIIIEILSRIG